MSENNNPSVEAEFEDIQETPESEESKIRAGVLIFQTDEGALGYQPIGELSLENFTYYTRYLNEIEKQLWSEEITNMKQKEA